MGIYVFSAVVTALCVLAGFGLYRSHQFEKKLAGRLDLVVRASHTCASRMNTACEKLDTMQRERKGNFEHQRKVSEHQRVLLASLNRQIQNFDSQLTNVPRDGHKREFARRSDEISTTASSRGGPVRQSIDRTVQDTSKVSKGGNGVVRLEEMFSRMETRNEIIHRSDETLDDDKYVAAASMGDLEDEFRRAVNG